MNAYSSPPSVTLLAFSPVNQDARVLRQVYYVSRQYPVSVIGYGFLDVDKLPSVKMLPLSPVQPGRRGRMLRTILLLPLGRVFKEWSYEHWYWGREPHREALKHLVESKPTLIHANDWNALPVGLKAAQMTQAKVILDLHEYAPLEGEERWHWRTFISPMIDYFLRRYAPYAAAHVTVNETIAQKYHQEYRFRPTVVMNIPQIEQAVPFKATNPESIHLVHHGVAKRDRQLERMIQTVAMAQPRFHLHFMLLETSQEYVTELKTLAQQLAPTRIHFHPAVSPSKIVVHLAEYDMGFYLLPFSNYNNSVALPNKFFDFIAAGLALCIGPSPEMARLTQQHGFGKVADSFAPSEVANILNQLSAADIDQMKKKAHEAKQVLNADTEMNKLTDLYDQILEKKAQN